MIYPIQYIIGLCLFLLFFPLIHIGLIMCLFSIHESINGNKKILKNN